MKNNNQIDKSIFLLSRQLGESENIPEDVDKSFFKDSYQPTIPPIGIAEPGLVEKSLQSIEDPQSLQNYIDDLESYKREEPFDTLKREVASHSARAFEGLGGFYGDMQELISAITGVGFQEKEQLDRDELMSLRIPSPDIMEGANLSKRLPTTKELREQSKESFGEYLEPKTEMEMATQEIAQDIGSMFAIPGNIGWIQKILLPITGQTSKQIVKKFGGSEKQQDLAKLSTMGISSLLHLGNAPRVAANALREAEQMIPRGLSFTSLPTERALGNIRNSNWYRSGATPAKQPAMSMIERIEDQIRNGRIDGQMAMQLRRDLNEARRNMGGFNVPMRADRRQALRYLDQVDNALLQSMENYGTHINPNWWRNYQLANEAFRVTRRSQALSEFIHSNGGRKVASETAKYLFIPAITGSYAAIPTLATGAAIGYTGMKSVQILNRIIRSPVLRNHYANVVRASATGNAKATKDAIEKFDSVAKKLENQSKSSKSTKSST